MAVFHSFAGVDIHAVFNNVQFGELQMVSYKIDREKSFVYTMGSPDPRTTARGKRGISGACIFVVFEKDTLLDTMNKSADKHPWLSKQETANYKENPQGGYDSQAPGGGSIGLGAGGTNAGLNTGGIYSVNERAPARLADQILPFDIILVGANEYGKKTEMAIQGVEFMSQASGMSIDDLVIEKQQSFIARHVRDWNNGRFAQESQNNVAQYYSNK